ncbi:hypothetical protein [Bradyrhizobium sp.]
MKSRYMTIQTMLRAAYVIEWLPGFSEAWNKSVIGERSPKRTIVNSLAAS